MKKIVTGDHRLVKSLNSQIVLNLIRTRQPIYGADLAKITGLRPSTIMNILKGLMNDQLILVHGTGNSSTQGGRRPTLYEIRSDYGYIIGLRIELNGLQGILIDLNSHVLARTMVPIDEQLDLPGLMAHILRVIDSLIVPQNIPRSKVLGVGIGVSGMVDSHNGVIVKTDLVKERHVPLRTLLRTEVDTSVFIENDANAAALYEKWYDQGKSISNYVFALLVIDQHVFGMGYGIMIDDRLYRGAHRFAGETMPHPLSIDQVLSYITVSETPDIQLAGEQVAKKQVHINRLVAAARSGDVVASTYFVELGKIVAAELGRIIMILDPELIILSGDVMQAESILMPAIEQALKIEVGDRLIPHLSICRSDDAVAMGATTLILQDIFQKPILHQRHYQ